MAWASEPLEAQIRRWWSDIALLFSSSRYPISKSKTTIWLRVLGFEATKSFLFARGRFGGVVPGENSAIFACSVPLGLTSLLKVEEHAAVRPRKIWPFQ